MKSLGESGVAEEGSFQIGQSYNYLKNIKKQMGVKRGQEVLLVGLKCEVGSGN